jgi:hypothetical protein
VFSAVAWAGYADNAASSPETAIAVGLHTADPGDAGDMSSSEAAYASYARQSVGRGNGSAAVAGAVSPSDYIAFPVSGAAGTTLTHFSTGKTGGGAAPILWSGIITPAIAIGGPGVTPRLTPAMTIALV